MKEQNWDLMNKYVLEGKKFWEGNDWVVNYLLTSLNYESIYEIVKGARAGQQYLRELVKSIDVPAGWYTPLYNFPVKQPSFKSLVSRVKTPLGTLVMFTGTQVLDRQKQLSSIAANYIHSIDSTLLLYCVDHMSSDIGVIHDCFLVHPNKGDEIRHHYKEGYIDIMESKPLESISKRLDPDSTIPIPYVGDLDLDAVRLSEYIIS